MALNSCSINGFTIDARKCRDKFAALVPILHPPIVSTTVGGNQRVLRDTFVRDYERELVDKPVLAFEQPFITVEVQILGATGSETQDVQATNVDFVTITDLKFGGDSITVNITDLSFE